MSVEDWRESLVYLFKCCREHPTWPKNFEQCLEWQDDDAREYLLELRELDKKGAFKF